MPGLGQLYNRDDAKAAAILCSTFGIWAALAWTTVGPDASRSWLSAVALLMVYPFLLLPAVLDAHRRASGIPEVSSTGARRWHVVIMLLVIGPLAIPQLWQSQGFSRSAKILWTFSVDVLCRPCFTDRDSGDGRRRPRPGALDREELCDGSLQVSLLARPAARGR
jgi:hypothetical protein